ncbi:tyrosine-type recombinase/integrase [Cohnella massiliensis]|uniref:tyrosine-type recombinase/integrase n=1 Tax=Cohnella massiliensis TaxID=1816691 RepID=UPI0009BBADBD|nr:tyrosine-type recombinase/integrase [Cohnella massiliensis]
MRIDAVAALCLKRLEADGKSANTLRGYEMCFRRFLNWLAASWGEVTEIEDVTQTVVRDFKAFLQSRMDVRTQRQFAPATINQNLIALRTLLVFAGTLGVQFRSDPISAIKLIPVAKQNETRWLNQDEVAKIFHAIELLKRTSDKRKALYKAVVSVLVNCGLRVDEAANLMLTDVILQSGLIVVRSGKGGKYRHVPFKQKTKNTLERWLSYHDRKSPYLFYSQRSNRMTTRAIQHMIEKLSELTKIDFTVHQLRHTYAKGVARESGQIETVASLLGHANIQTTRRYIEPSMQEMGSVIERVEFE